MSVQINPTRASKAPLKTIMLFASASLMMGGIPLAAQTKMSPAPGEAPQTPPSPTPPETMPPQPDAPAPAPQEAPANPAPAEAPPPAAPPEAPTPPTTPQPMNAAPGTMSGAQNTTITNPPPAPQAVYPPCSATVRDQCQQREGRARPRRR